jgi:2',3'-cyclic-nucleotide 2'-phosphodiesterase (5'-nucleotidase family)
MRLTILHSNDIHGRIEGLARIATLVERVRAETDHPVVYLDAGDVEETSTRLSNITKGAGMHRLLSASGCDVATIGNAAWLRYGVQVLPEHAAASSHPLLLANFRPVEGVRSSAIVRVGAVSVGVIGVSTPFSRFSDGFDYGIEFLDVVPIVLELAGSLRKHGADLVVVLSHLGLDVPEESIDDRRLAEAVSGAGVDVVVGAHSHDLLAEGEWVSGVLVAQAGSYAEHLGRIEVENGRLSASLIAVDAGVPIHPAVLQACDEVEREAQAMLDEVIGELPQPLDQDAAAAWLAEVTRERMGADVGLATAGQAFTGGLPGGPLRRGALWDVCETSANPGVARMSGAHLRAMIARGRDPEFMRSTAHALRGRPRGRLHVTGPDEIDPDRAYLVAASDWELETYGGLVEPDWELDVRYDFPTIIREALEEHLAARRNG